MAKYKEWENLKELHDQILIVGYEFPTGEKFYIEGGFYTQLQGIKERYPNEYGKVIAQMEKVCKSNKKVIFCVDFENPFLDLPGYILHEITDVTDPIKVYYEDKSRGSDYGD